MSLFKRLRRASETASAATAATFSAATVATLGLPPHVYAAVGSAVLFARGDMENHPPIVQFTDGRSFHYVAKEAEADLARSFPYLDGEQLRAAHAFLRDRIIANARMQGELRGTGDPSRKKWSASTW